MTTSVIVRPAGHHVRVTLQPVPKGAAEPAVHDLDPSTPERTFYVHDGLSLSVEEFTPE